MFKNTIISGLLVYMFAKVPGWRVDGFSKFIVCAILTILIGLMITELEKMIKDFIAFVINNL